MAKNQVRLDRRGVSNSISGSAEGSIIVSIELVILGGTLLWSESSVLKWVGIILLGIGVLRIIYQWYYAKEMSIPIEVMYKQRRDEMKSDSEIQSDVIQELNWNPAVTETHVGVSVSNGIVTLSGHVPTFVEKVEAERSVQRVEGVQGVVDCSCNHSVDRDFTKAQLG